MKTFFDGIYIKSNEYAEEYPEYPIKLEYYKTIETEENVEAKFGIEIVETQFIQGKVYVESKSVEKISNKETKIEEILTILRDNVVTPIGVQDVLEDMFVQI